ncbi:chitin deacetylase [Crucibulum laeve]|uniref:Chitin deacetylase n=1 Tax=Crucibulum laeve TaxID=68775 RepID=A0A5C3LUU4_9AGAR|nr:chitin deacetylase [Crucibulum laeve]
MLIPIVIASLLLAVGLVSAAPGFQKRAPAQIITQCTVPNTVALTFDDGPYVYLYDVSKALKAAGAVGTFFFNGNNYGCIYDADQAKRVKYAYDKGHQVASHTWSHAHLNTLNWDQLHNEFWLVEEALMKITGAYPAFARPPYGEYNDLVREVAGVRGQSLAIWDFDSGDSTGLTAAQSNQLYTNVANAHPSTILALNHEVYEQTAHVVLPHAISVLQSKGYRLVTLAECLGQSPYQWVAAPQARDSSWTCAGK